MDIRKADVAAPGYAAAVTGYPSAVGPGLERIFFPERLASLLLFSLLRLFALARRLLPCTREGGAGISKVEVRRIRPAGDDWPPLQYGPSVLLDSRGELWL
jgi:energy-coupling factor transporter transmembrane protein EcfT